MSSASRIPFWGALQAAFATAAIWWAVPSIASGWLASMELLADSFAPIQRVEQRSASVWGRKVRLPAPVVGATRPLRSFTLAVALGSVALCFGVGLFPSGVHGPLPLRIGLCLVSAIQLIACLCALWRPVDYESGRYVADGLAGSLRLLLAIPFVLWMACGPWNPGGSRLWRLVLLMTVFLAVFPPLQYLSHTVTIQAGTTLFMPLLYVVFGPFLHVAALISLYGYGMSDGHE